MVEPDDTQAFRRGQDALTRLVGGTASGVPLGVAAAPREGDVLGGAALVSILGRGGMGVVWRAHDAALGRDVAVKVLRRLAQPAELERFRAEGQAAARLRHPNVVRVHTAGEARGWPFLVMDLVEGESLQRRLEREGRLAPRAAVEIARALASALDHAHARGVVHRDVKPANVLLDAGGDPRLADFGLARDLLHDAQLTPSGAVVGTPAYMAPEQLDGRPVDGRADVWSLGATLHELLAGAPPWSGLSGSPLLAARQRPIATGVDQGLDGVLRACLASDPTDRYPTAGALEANLARWLAGESPRPPGARAGLQARAVGGFVAVLVGVLVVAVAATTRPSGPAARPTEAPAPIRSTDGPAPSPGRDQGEGRRAWDDVRAARADDQGARARSWLARFPDHPLAPRARELALARPAQVIELGQALGHGLFSDDALFLVVHADLDQADGVVVDAWTLDGSEVVTGPQRVHRVAGLPHGRPALRPRAGTGVEQTVRRLVFGARRDGGVPHQARLLDLVLFPVEHRPGATPTLPRVPRSTQTYPLLPEAPEAFRWTSKGRLLATFVDSGLVREPTESCWVDLSLVPSSSVVHDVLEVSELLIVAHGDTSSVPAAILAVRSPADPVWSVPVPGRPTRLAASPDGGTLAVGTELGHIVLLDLRDPSLRTRLLDGGTGARTDNLVAHGGQVVALFFTPDGRRLLSIGGPSPGNGSEGEFRLWDVEAGTQVGATRRLLGEASLLARSDLSPDGRHLLVGRRGAVEVWRVE